MYSRKSFRRQASETGQSQDSPHHLHAAHVDQPFRMATGGSEHPGCFVGCGLALDTLSLVAVRDGDGDRLERGVDNLPG